MVDHIQREFGQIEENLKSIGGKQDRMIDTIDKIFQRLEGKNGITREHNGRQTI